MRIESPFWRKLKQFVLKDKVTEKLVKPVKFLVLVLMTMEAPRQATKITTNHFTQVDNDFLFYS